MDGGGEEGPKQIVQILAEREAELQHMMKILQKDMTLEGGNNSWGLTTTLRAVALK